MAGKNTTANYKKHRTISTQMGTDIHLRKLQSVLRKLKLLAKTEFIFLYGSQSNGKATPQSDIDICVSLPLPSKERYHARIKIGGALPEDYDVKIFQDLPLYIKKEVFSGKLLYCKDKKKVIGLALQTIQDYEDFQPAYEQYVARNSGEIET